MGALSPPPPPPPHPLKLLTTSRPALLCSSCNPPKPKPPFPSVIQSRPMQAINGPSIDDALTEMIVGAPPYGWEVLSNDIKRTDRTGRVIWDKQVRARCMGVEYGRTQ